MYTIGQISKIVNISANTLRYYDEIGLLKPILIKNSNKYRYYSDSQIKEIAFIIELKQYGFTLYEIKELMENKNSLNFKSMLEEKCTELYKEIDRIKDSAILLEKRISEIIKEEDLKMKGGRVLIVDDLKLVRIMIKNIIQEYGYTVVGEASNGKEAIIAYEQLKPDLVIMDITMPKMDGIDSARKITEKHKNARIIMCSARNNVSIILESIEAGAIDFVSKPLSSLRLINAIARSFDDNYIVDLKKIDYISKILVKNDLEKANFNISLKQEEIDFFISKIIKENEDDEFIYNFLKKVNYNCINKAENSVIKNSTMIEEKVLVYLKDKFLSISDELSAYSFRCCQEKCIVNLLSVENITIGEFKTLMKDDNSIGVIKYKEPYSPIYINIYAKDKQEITKEFFNTIANKLNSFLPKYKAIDMILNGSNLVLSLEEYPIVLVSFELKFAIDEKFFFTISIPHDILNALLI